MSTRIRALAATLALALTVPLAASARTTARDASEALESEAPAEATTFAAETFMGPNALLATLASCSSGPRSLSSFGARVYPDQGNGGYRSVHTDLYINYDAPTNLFLPGTHADLTIRASQCLTDFSFDFERTALSGSAAGPNLAVSSVSIDGQPATFEFRQPAYPGNPNGSDDPDPAAHAISNANPVSATNPNPPACSPQTSGNTQNGLQCPATKLVITPAQPVADGATVKVTINYTGRPGVHVDGDGSTEGWFRVNTAAAPNDGAFVTTEPIGNMAWMPLNNHPSAKPTYDFYDTTNVGKTAIASGELVGFAPPVAALGGEAAAAPTSVNAPDANFPAGSWTWHWHSPEPIANYLVENSIGSYDLVARTSATSGTQYFQALASGLTDARKAAIRVNVNQHEDITEFQKLFNGAYPFTTAGIVVALPSVGFAEEMQTKITFGNGASSTPSLGTINHESMHQWFGDNVAESAFNLTFWKEGFATVGEYLNTARTAAGGASSGPAFESSLIGRFNGTANYGTTSSTFWTSAPSNPTVGNLFSTASTYTRPATSYLALWQTLGRERMISAMKDIQSTYGGGSITETQLEEVFRKWLPVPTVSCNARLDQFFPEWFDTAYPTGGTNTTNKPKITGPGLNGTGFVCAAVAPASPDGKNGWYTGPVSVTWQGFGAPAVTKTGCDDGPVGEGEVTRACSVTTTAAPILTSGAVSETLKHDSVKPAVTYTGNAGAYTVDQTIAIDCASTDAAPGSGVASDTCVDLNVPAYTLALGSHTLSATAEDVAGNVGSGSATFTVGVTSASLQALVTQFSTDPDVTKGLNDKLTAASNAKTALVRGNVLDAFASQVKAQTGKALTADQAQLLLALANTLR